MAHYGAKGRATSDILTLVSYDFQKKTSINPLVKPTFSLSLTH